MLNLQGTGKAAGLRPLTLMPPAGQLRKSSWPGTCGRGTAAVNMKNLEIHRHCCIEILLVISCIIVYIIYIYMYIYICDIYTQYIYIHIYIYIIFI